MAHSLQAQAALEIILAPSDEPELLEARVRAHFGSAPPIRWAASLAHAIRSALVGEAIAIVPEPLAEPQGELRMFDSVTSEDGRPIAYAVGRIAADEIVSRPATSEPPRSYGLRAEWAPASWRSRPAQQIADYPDRAALERVEQRLAGSESLVEIADIIHLRAALGKAANGEAVILQGGDCAESFAEFNADKVRVTYNLLLRMGAMLRASWAGDVIHLARIAGQFAKPRSSPTETIGGSHPAELPRAMQSTGRPSPPQPDLPIPSGCSRRIARRRSPSSCSTPMRPRPMRTYPRCIVRSASPSRPGRSRCSPATRPCFSITSRR